MADLVTHLATVLLPAALLRRPRGTGLAAVGVVLPDAASRVPSLLLETLNARAMALPEWMFWPWGVLHEPIGALLLCAVVAGRFVPKDRLRAMFALGLGTCAHTALDLIQDHHGQGYYLFAPISMFRFEFGWIGSEASVWGALPLAALTALVWWLRPPSVQGKAW